MGKEINSGSRVEKGSGYAWFTAESYHQQLRVHERRKLYGICHIP